MSRSRGVSHSLIHRLRHGVDRVLAAFGEPPAASQQPSWAPPLDIAEQQDRFVVHALLPGIAPQDVEVMLQNGALIITGQLRSGADDGHRPDARGGRRFFRRLLLPNSASADNVVATTRDGVLEVSIPKRGALPPGRAALKS